MVRLVINIVNAIGEITYYVMYVPIYVAWHLVGKPVKRILDEVRGQDQVSVDLSDIVRYGNITQLRELLVNAYYHKLLEEAACARYA